MKKTKRIFTITVVFVFLFYSLNLSGNNDQSDRSNSLQTVAKSNQTKKTSAQTTTKAVTAKTKSTQTTTKSVSTKAKSTQTKTKTVPAKPKSAQTGTKAAKPKATPVTKVTTPEPVKKIKESGTVIIGSQIWAEANLNVSTFRNGDTIPEAKTNKEWVTAGESGKPAWCYYNNDPAYGTKYGKLYNWYAVNDPRGLAPEGWSLPDETDWLKLASSLGGPNVAGLKLKSINGWSDGNNGDNGSGFIGLPAGYRIENGIFKNSGSIATWWSLTESKSTTAIDIYLAQTAGLNKSSNPKLRGESVRCLKK